MHPAKSYAIWALAAWIVVFLFNPAAGVNALELTFGRVFTYLGQEIEDTDPDRISAITPDTLLPAVDQ